MEASQAVKALAALAQSSRLAIFRALVVAGPKGCTPSALSAALDLTGPALSFHLKELLQAGLVTQEREGRHLIYRAELGQMNALLAYLTEHCCEGASCAEVTDFQCKSHGPKEHTMSEPVFNVLFLCTANSARSIMAEAILNQLGAGRFRAYSAGSHPAAQINPDALELLQRNHFKTDRLYSKDWTEFARSDAPHMHFVLTVCDKAAGEVCPVWPGQPLSAHWGVADPVEVQGDAATRLKAFSEAFLVLNRRIALLVNLPIEKLDRLALHKELAAIGRSTGQAGV